MLIDWFTVAVQIVNFLVLLFLLRRFLYGPLLRAMDQRQRTMAERMEQAAQAEQEATTQLALLIEERAALSGSREALLRQAAVEVEAWRQAAMDRLRQEFAEHRRLWQQQLTEEQAGFYAKLKLRLGEQVVRVSTKVLADLADQGLEERLLDLFLAKLGMDHDRADQRREEGDLLVTSGHPLAPDHRERVRRALTARFGAGRGIQFQEEPGLGFGIRLTLDDQAWEWNLACYMDELEQDIRQALALMRKPGESDA